MSRRSKIAALPEAVRADVNRRLADGHTARSIADWLSDLPEVQALLRERFNNEPVSESNVSAWRLGGYQDWLERRDDLDLVRELSAQASDLASATQAAPTPGAALLASAKLFQALQACDPVADPSRFRLLVLGLADLRVAEDAERRLQLAQQRLQQADRKLLFEERRVKALEARLAAARGLLPPPESKGGITPETLARIEKELHIL